MIWNALNKTIVLIVLTLISSPLALGADREIRCNLIGTNQTQSKTASYDQPHFRTLKTYEEIIPYQTANYLKTPGIKLLDVGGGYGLAALEASYSLHRKSDVVNVQNFWSFLETQFKAKEGILLEPRDYGKISTWSINDIPLELITNFLRITEKNQNINENHIFRLAEDKANQLKQKISSAMEEHKKQKNFGYHVGYAEEVLPGIKSTYNIITDIYGAFFYSPNRHQLLKQYWEKLEPTGEMVILLGKIVRPNPTDSYATVDFTRAEMFKNTVRLKNGKIISYVDWLLEKFGTTATLETSPTQHLAYLRIEKPAYNRSVDFLDEISTNKDPKYSGNTNQNSSFKYPITTYQSKK